MLICKFASPRSDPDRIDRWISYLETLKSRHKEDRDAAMVLDRLLAQARVWMSGTEVEIARSGGNTASSEFTLSGAD